MFPVNKLYHSYLFQVKFVYSRYTSLKLLAAKPSKFQWKNQIRFFGFGPEFTLIFFTANKWQVDELNPA